MEVPLTPEHGQSLTFQRYDTQPTIDGVSLLPLIRHRQLEGSFMELLRLGGGQAALPGGGVFDVRQISIATAEPGRINAFHVHPKRVQDELWHVSAGRLLVWLVDLRASGKTEGVQRSCLLDGEQPTLLHIPAGVAHGYKAGPAGATLIYAASDQFDAADPNEGRLPWDHFGAELWEADRG
jgi:dTDP-4-dehydrorhamnose 3,5-epimerase